MDRQRQLVSGLHCGGVPKNRDSFVPNPPQDDWKREAIETGAVMARTARIRSVASDRSDM